MRQERRREERCEKCEAFERGLTYPTDETLSLLEDEGYMCQYHLSGLSEVRRYRVSIDVVVSTHDFDKYRDEVNTEDEAWIVAAKERFSDIQRDGTSPNIRVERL